ncbi:unnamed protein product [Clonostachys byssicola]|uniref:Carboxymuconolactone decarboxylase-like domain-containing protein n=1 Tax=Clonostachys byssicola TaxID=160290 RepID=A0A9N9Y358_9HYPO|nr:unnamed protein product [Clonostachys byssicola]
MRLSYTTHSPSHVDAEGAIIIEAIRSRRYPRGLTPLDLALLHAPHIAGGWNAFLGAVRNHSSLPDDLREIAICRVAAVNRAWYEWMHHAPLAVGRGGMSEDSVTFLLEPAELQTVETPSDYTERQWVVAVVADEMTRHIGVPDDIFASLKRLFSESEIVEIISTIACYNCVSRFLVALDGLETFP